MFGKIVQFLRCSYSSDAFLNGPGLLEPVSFTGQGTQRKTPPGSRISASAQGLHCYRIRLLGRLEICTDRYEYGLRIRYLLVNTSQYYNEFYPLLIVPF